MKQGTVLTRAVMLLLFAAVCAYFAVAAWQSFHQSEYTMATYAYTVDDAVEATGLLVRQEEVILSGQAAAIVDVIPDQGEKVNAGGTVAYLYRDEAALERKRELRTLELEREQLIYSLQRGDTGWDNARLDQSIVDAMVGLKTSAAYGDLTGLEDQVLSFKSLVIRRGASSAGGAADIQAKVEEIDAQHAALQAAAGQDTTPIRVDKSGSFSAVADGYEALLTPDMLSTLTVSDLTALLVRKPEAPEGAVGKLITSSTWYFTAALPVKTAERLVEGRSVKVRFSRDWSGEVSMTIERVGEEEDGKCPVVLSSSRSLADTSLLRKQTVDIIFSSTTGIRVPKKAVRDGLVTSTDPETGETTSEEVPYEYYTDPETQAEVTTRVIGVYVLTGAQSEFKQVEILADDGDFYLVRASLPDNPTELQIKKAFRAGDEVIVSSEEIYDGKVILAPR